MGKKLGLEDKYKALKPNYLQYPVINSVKPNVTGKMYGGSVKKYLTGAQVKIAAKAEPKNKIDAKDFAVLRAEKAKGRGMGLQDEKMQPGKIMSAKKGKMAEKKIKKVMKEYKKGKLNIGKSKKKVKSRKQAIAIALAEARKKSKKS